MISRILKYAALIMIIFIFQTVFFGQSGFLKAKPDILLILVVAAAFFSENAEGLIVGLAVGIFRDLATTDSFGFYTILSILAVLMTGLLNRRIFKDNVFLFALIALAVSVSYELMACLLNALHDIFAASRIMSLNEYAYFLKTYSISAVLMEFLIAFLMFFVVRTIFHRRSDKTKGYA
jgi:rod shape-determining protein MreD